MTEKSGVTILAALEVELSSLSKTLKAVGTAENTSEACSRVISNILTAEDKDGFLVTEGGAVEQNQYLRRLYSRSPLLWNRDLGNIEVGDDCSSKSVSFVRFYIIWHSYSKALETTMVATNVKKLPRGSFVGCTYPTSLNRMFAENACTVFRFMP